MQQQSLTRSTTGPDWHGGGALKRSYMMPLDLTMLDFGSGSGIALTNVEKHPFGSTVFRTSIDVTGGSISTLPQHIAYRLACMLYVCMIPQTGLKEAAESLADIFNWYTKPISPQILPDRRHLFIAATMTDVKAPPMVFDEE
jgi:hypothetical protein